MKLAAGKYTLFKRRSKMNEEKVIAEELNETEEVAEFRDETLVCVECGKEFIFSAGEQAFYKEKGYVNKPKRCRECRNAKKAKAQTERTYYYAVCDECGAEAKLPFEPSADKPVYCSVCHGKHLAERRAKAEAEA